MHAAVIFHGTSIEQSELLAALTRNCTCEYGVMGVRKTTCPGHTSLATDQKYVDHLEFARTLRAQLMTQEFREQVLSQEFSGI